MKAWVLHGKADLRYETVKLPQPAAGEVLVEVRAAGICGSDIPRIYRTGAHRHPLIPGHEFSGVVADIGSFVDPAWMGKRVGIFPLIPCGGCLPCRRKQYEMCKGYDYLGSRRDGGFAEYAAVPAWNLIELPESVSFEAAAMLEPLAVAAHALRRVSAGGRGTVAVCGLGTIGLSAVMLLLGQEGGMSRDFAEIYAIGNKESQRQRLLDMGLPESAYCDSRKEDAGQWLRDRTGGAGVDIFLECVGKQETYGLAVDHTAAAGRICLVGNPASDMRLEQSVYWKILRGQLTITGTWNSSFTHSPEDDWHDVLGLLSQGKLCPERLISHRFPMPELDDGLQLMRDKREDYGKVMGSPSLSFSKIS